MSLSLVPEEWGLVSHGIDPEERLPYALVARKKLDVEQRFTIWKLLQRPNGWYNVGQYISQGRYRTYPEKKGVKLSDSRIDTILREFATLSHSSMAS